MSARDVNNDQNETNTRKPSVVGDGEHGISGKKKRKRSIKQKKAHAKKLLLIQK